MSHHVTVQGAPAVIEITRDEPLGVSGLRRVEGRLATVPAGWEVSEERFAEGPTLRGTFRLCDAAGALLGAGPVWIKGE